MAQQNEEKNENINNKINNNIITKPTPYMASFACQNDPFFNGQSQNVPAIKNSFFRAEEPFFNGPFKIKYEPCNPIHFEPPKESQKDKYLLWYPTHGSLSNGCYKQTRDFADARPPLPLPVYKKINIKRQL